MINFFSNIKNAIVIGVIAFALGGSVSWYVSYKFHEAAKVDMYDVALNEQKAAVRRAINQHETIRNMDNEFLNVLIEESEVIQESETDFQKRVGIYVKKNDICNLTVGAVGMLNTLVEGGQSNVSTLPKAASPDDEEGRKTSKVSQLKTLQHHGTCVSRYNKLMSQHNNTVDWINKTYGALQQNEE